MKLICCTLLASCLLTTNALASSVFTAYEFGEMSFNGFKNFAGEIGYTLKNDRSIRMVYMNVALSERHLSSSEANAVSGDNVEGKWVGVEFFYDLPLKNSLTENLYWSISAANYKTTFRHTLLDEKVENRSNTVGLALSYTETGMFGLDNFYWRFSLPFRYSFDPIQRTSLGDAVVQGGSTEVNPWIFVGYKFK